MATKAFASVKSLQPFQRFGPTAAGLALIPFLPMICDEPVEKIVDTAFDTLWPTKKHARQDLVESAPETKKEL
ncbi:hypothetical protein SARC_03513 [Sphaeroforma arctica JP610]|uniref:Uncharacterized protein n=1 Tax=Sphaeroforma arctica JP610 TaxID=667725 RepID=A0A0L0G5G0_9EUKA|nr:hypothetical protein SARC_03513 [Sphaeroforma arctica JP610]KNC84265.1 hypothetical protein SARC_03513 [Sphaeroforma arctica JP610]|eukprot:XP_014158167.1 hypothetical protein SARC_03513 [Sphaeroforma arctica JP610]